MKSTQNIRLKITLKVLPKMSSYFVRQVQVNYWRASEATIRGVQIRAGMVYIYVYESVLIYKCIEAMIWGCKVSHHMVSYFDVQSFDL